MKILRKILDGLNNGKMVKSELEIKGFIYATIVFSHGWNDSSEIIKNQKSIILDTVTDEREKELKLNYWNKLYYNDLPFHYSLEEKQFELISEIVNIKKEKVRELYKYWKDSISESQYRQILTKLKLKFVQYRPIEKIHNGKFIITINESFWKIKVQSRYLLADIINTYERKFQDFELIHNTYDEAMKYGIIIIDRLCNQRGPENSYYYEQKIKEQVKQFDNLPIFNFDSYKDTKESIGSEYKRIIQEKKSELELMKNIIEMIPEKPFKLIKLKTMPNLA